MKWLKKVFANRRRPLEVDSLSTASRKTKRHLSMRKKLGNLSPSTTEPSISSIENSCGVAARKDAAWRTENILVNGPPSEAEWWDGDSLSGKIEEESDGMEWTEDSTDDSKRFHNRGYEVWAKGRSEWRKVTVNKAHLKKPPPVRYDQVVRGLRQGGRHVELPGRMNLKDLVEIYTAVWECSDPW
mmetsp:Transcript_31768/g.46854  ORF Transcript_31768/g.46854 Transcript_31768/m.46854 type:complete len:185 (+) Transcript_31768:165-719(+)|eukprot:CAMPEP_0194200692 /NCGR_PEP_ID=MMETSP0156-20130528/1188_1 /TAXON_ID=33649 /ORGANISM="Thalassionema nitzschioides, Strain L26-B" /LENGTH=184 /DNA_ID=CAMNT_0038925723 /DNA_START=69 /DNA_END=623 /DNA_ORIENTATION=-